jgi:hypothetical protein
VGASLIQVLIMAHYPKLCMNAESSSATRVAELRPFPFLQPSSKNLCLASLLRDDSTLLCGACEQRLAVIIWGIVAAKLVPLLGK